MPTELRHIIFLPSEVVQAVQMYYRRLERPLPAGSARSCAAALVGGVVRVNIAIQPDPVGVKNSGQGQAPPVRYVSVEGSVLAAALLLFCHERSIPMATKAEKSLQLIGRKVCFVTTLSAATIESADSGLLPP